MYSVKCTSGRFKQKQYNTTTCRSNYSLIMCVCLKYIKYNVYSKKYTVFYTEESFSVLILSEIFFSSLICNSYKIQDVYKIQLKEERKSYNYFMQACLSSLTLINLHSIIISQIVYYLSLIHI